MGWEPPTKGLWIYYREMGFTTPLFYSLWMVVSLPQCILWWLRQLFFIVIHFKQYLGSLLPPEPSLIKCKRAKGQPFLYNRASSFDIWLPTAFRSLAVSPLAVWLRPGSHCPSLPLPVMSATARRQLYGLLVCFSPASAGYLQSALESAENWALEMLVQSSELLSWIWISCFALMKVKMLFCCCFCFGVIFF